MKRIEVKLSLPVVAPLLDVIKTVADSLKAELASPLAMTDLDAALRERFPRFLSDLGSRHQVT